VTAITYKEEYGGLGADLLSMVIALEELARVSAACSTVFVASHLVSEPLNEWGTEEQKKRYLIPMVAGEKIGAHAMTEPGAGSDVAGINPQQNSRDTLGDIRTKDIHHKRRDSRPLPRFRKDQPVAQQTGETQGSQRVSSRERNRRIPGSKQDRDNRFTRLATIRASP